MPNDYALVRKARKGPKITMGKGMQREEKPDPMQGVTDPTKLLRADTQRIDRNVYTPEQQWENAPRTGFNLEAAGQVVKKI